jgi:hypothetical protein
MYVGGLLDEELYTILAWRGAQRYLRLVSVEMGG